MRFIMSGVSFERYEELLCRRNSLHVHWNGEGKRIISQAIPQDDLQADSKRGVVPAENSQTGISGPLQSHGLISAHGDDFCIRQVCLLTVHLV